MRAIDADAFKDYIRGACEEMKHLYKDNGAWAKEITESFCKDIDEQPTIQPEPHWIPCSERLPSKEGEYLITNNAGGVKNIEVDTLLHYEDGEPFWFYSQNPIAWRELPVPFGEE